MNQCTGGPLDPSFPHSIVDALADSSSLDGCDDPADTVPMTQSDDDTVDSGPVIQLGSPLEVFLSLLTGQLLRDIVVQTNKYAMDCLTAAHSGDGPAPQWQTDVEEIKAYFGFCILMGINKTAISSGLLVK